MPMAVHGTYMKNWASILATGLNSGSRQHIHLAIGRPGDGTVISGARRFEDYKLLCVSPTLVLAPFVGSIGFLAF